MPAASDSEYDISRDTTLTPAQRNQGGFQPSVAARVTQGGPGTGLRVRSNATAAGYSTGYHEAFGTTDFFATAGRRHVSDDGTASTMPDNARGPLGRDGSEMREANMESFFHASDTTRTDTAQTVLSAPGGEAAGHSGSGVRTTGQGAAHDLPREVSMAALSDRHLDESGMSLLSGSVAVASMAPGEIARRAEQSGQLKAGSHARARFEFRRNEAKRRLTALTRSTDPRQVRRVRTHLNTMFNHFPGRHLAPQRPASPIRDPHGPSDDIAGGGYAPGGTDALDEFPSLAPPTTTGSTARDSARVGAYVTQPFRAERPAAKAKKSAGGQPPRKKARRK